MALLLLVCIAAACALVQEPAVNSAADVPREGHRVFQYGLDEQGTSYAIYPTQRLPLTFDHARHMQLAGVTCERCHDAAARSERVADRLIPPERTCLPCHAIDHDQPERAATPVARCDGCHVGFDAAHPVAVERVLAPPANLVFSHRAHETRGMRCADCHGDMHAVTLATRLELPTMQRCLECHRDGATARSACVTCHLTEADGVMRTRFAEGLLNPPTWMNGLHHDADFWVNHRTAAADNGARCAVCHRESDCLDCHDGRVRDRRTHPNDYVTLHGVEARQASNTCTSCHREASFCIACHQRMGVADSSPTAERALGRFHPPASQWSGAVVTSGHHAIEARRALGTCVACHTERDCTTCHAGTGLGGGGIDPHPPGFASRCGAMLRASPRGCAQCHEDTGSLAARCR